MNLRYEDNVWTDVGIITARKCVGVPAQCNMSLPSLFTQAVIIEHSALYGLCADELDFPMIRNLFSDERP